MRANFTTSLRLREHASYPCLSKVLICPKLVDTYQTDQLKPGRLQVRADSALRLRRLALADELGEKS